MLFSNFFLFIKVYLIFLFLKTLEGMVLRNLSAGQTQTTDLWTEWGKEREG